MRLVLLGPPGAGKGTQSGIICAKFNIVHISTGDQLREAVKKNTSIGKKAKDYMQQGKLVPDNIVLEIIVESLKRDKILDNFILDGFPRTKKQAVDLDNELEKLDKAIQLVLYFNTDDKVSIQRLSGRRICEKCGANYHVTNRPSLKEDICDKCKGYLIQRKDDKPEVVKERLKVYKEQTAPLLDYYNDKNIKEEVNGNLEAEDVFEKILDILKKRKII